MSQPLSQLPIPNGCYRLQHQGRKSVAALPNALQSPTGSVIEQDLDDNTDQIWVFYRIGDKYQIISASSPTTWLSSRFQDDGETFRAFPVGSKTQTEWTIESGRVRGFRLHTPDEQKTEMALNISAKGEPTLFPKDLGNQGQLWNIIPVGPSVQTASSPYPPALENGQYRIRNLNPLYVLTAPGQGADQDSRAYVEEQSKSVQQQWELVKKHGDRYHIRSKGTSNFLAHSTDDGPLGVRLSNRPTEWQVISAGGLGNILAVPDSHLALGFADYRADQGDKVTLVDNIRAHSQVWFFEAWRDLQRDAKYQTDPNDQSKRQYGGN